MPPLYNIYHYFINFTNDILNKLKINIFFYCIIIENEIANK